MKPIPYGRQEITEDDIEAVVDVLRSDFLTQGPKVGEFENAFAEYVGAKYAVAVANGTAALHLCSLTMVKPGDKVITTPITFVASANCVRYAGGEVVFADIDPDTYLLDIHQVEKLLKTASKGTYRGLIVVDFAGRAVDLESFRELADRYGCWIIEDACHAPGAYFVDSQRTEQHCGNGKYAHLGVFSFHPVKHIAAGEGGMITTNDKALYKKLCLLRNHGITKNPPDFLIPDGPIPQGHHGAQSAALGNHSGWYYEMQELGFNYRLTDFQAALGLSQLQRAEKGLSKRKAIAARYAAAFQGKPFIKGQAGVVDGHGYHLYVIEVEDRRRLYEHLRRHDIFAQVHYIPAHLMPYYRQFGWREGDMPYAEEFYNNCLSIPMYPAMTSEDQARVIEAIDQYYL